MSLVLSVLSDAATKDVGPEGINRNDPAYVMGLFAMCCVVLSTMFTYGIGGRWMHSHTQWTFFQPGEGGRHFVLMQVMSSLESLPSLICVRQLLATLHFSGCVMAGLPWRVQYCALCPPRTSMHAWWGTRGTGATSQL